MKFKTPNFIRIKHLCNQLLFFTAQGIIFPIKVGDICYIYAPKKKKFFWYLLEPPQWGGGSNKYPKFMHFSRNKRKKVILIPANPTFRHTNWGLPRYLSHFSLVNVWKSVKSNSGWKYSKLWNHKPWFLWIKIQLQFSCGKSMSSLNYKTVGYDSYRTRFCSHLISTLKHSCKIEPSFMALKLDFYRMKNYAICHLTAWNRNSGHSLEFHFSLRRFYCNKYP